MDELYNNIRKQRKKLGLTQSELAKMLGYADKSMIAKIEKGVVNLPQSKIYDFAKAFGVSPAYLLGLEQERFQYAYGAEVAEEKAQYTVKYEEQNELNAVYTRLSDCNKGKVVTYAKNLLAAQEMEEELVLKAANAKQPTLAQGKHADDIMHDPTE